MSEPQSPEYRESMPPASVRARLADKGGVRLGWHKRVRDRRDSMGDSPFRRFRAEAAVARECDPTAEQVYQQAPVLFTKRSR